MIVDFGSLNVDLIVKVEHLPAPGETVLCPDYVMVPGGKGANQACAAARAAKGDPAVTSERIAMVGAVGDDDFGPKATALLAEAGVDLTAMSRVDRPTACALIWVDSRGENSIVVASGANLALTADRLPASLLGPQTTVLLQAEVPLAENWAVVRRAHAAGARVVLNVAPAAPVPEDVLRSVGVLVVNEIEARMIAEAGGLAADTPTATAAALAGRYGHTCIVTLGGEGAAAFGPGGAWQVDALKVDPVDTTGAGDAFVGVLAQGLDGGLALPEAMRRASVGAALACLTLGCQSSYVTGDAIRARLDDLAPPRRIG
ncbi:MAG: ribokinase [Alphaproteobacteria bacterium]